MVIQSFVYNLAKADTATETNNSSQAIIVIGQRDTPISIQPRGLSVSLNKNDFEAINAINVEDLMKYAPNFYVRKRFAGDDNAVVALRGANTVQSARTIVMVDGFLVSNFLGNLFSFPPKWNVVGPAEVRQFDIVYGPYSARYGGNSMGGIVSITTQEPKENGGYLNAQYATMPFKEYGVDNNFNGYNIEAGANYKQKDGPLSARFSYRHFDSIGQPMSYSAVSNSTGTGTIVTGLVEDNRLLSPKIFAAASPTNVLQDQYRGRVGYEINNDWNLDILGMYWKNSQENEKPISFLKDINGNAIYDGKVIYNGQTYSTAKISLSNTQRDEYLAGIKLSGKISNWDFKTNISQYAIPKWNSYSSNDYQTGINNGAGTITKTKDIGWWAFDMGLEREFNNHKVAIGTNGYLYQTAQDVFNTTNWRNASNQSFNSSTGGKTSVYGYYVEDEINLNDIATLTIGGRFDYWKAFDGYISKQSGANIITQNYAKRTDSSFSPKASLSAEIAPDWFAQFSVGTATRFPTVGELFSAKFLSGQNSLDLNSFDPNLKPEKSTDMSFLLRHNFGNVRVTSSLFYQDIENAIYSFSALTPNQNGDIISGNQNIDLVTQYGLELIFEGKDFLINGLDYDFSITRMNAKTIRNLADLRTEGVSFPRIPDWRANGNIRYKIKENLKANLGWRYASRPNSQLFDVRGDAYGYQSEYFYIDTRLIWDMNKNLKLGIGIDNINNDHGYVSHPMPQRTYVADIKYKF